MRTRNLLVALAVVACGLLLWTGVSLLEKQEERSLESAREDSASSRPEASSSSHNAPGPSEDSATPPTPPSGGMQLAVEPEDPDPPFESRRTTSRFKGTVIDESLRPTDEPDVFERVRLLETDFHYPLLRVVERVRNPGQADEIIVSSTEMVGTHVLVKKQADVSEEAFAELLKSIDASITKRHSLPGLYRVGIPARTVNDLPDALTFLNAHPSVVEYAEPDSIVHANATQPDDPDFINGTLWGLNNTGQDGGVADKDIDAPEGWDIRTNASGVVVAVIDTGILYTHEDLAANMWTNTAEFNGTPGVDDDANGYIDDIHGINAITGSGDPLDNNRHGTHCAGTIGGVGNNSTGVTGVAWNVQLMALKFLGAGGGGASSDAAECVVYAVQNGASVLSNSWGGGSYTQTLADAISQSEMGDALFIAAAGNNGQNVDPAPYYPSAYPNSNIVAVASYTREGFRSSFSNYGPATVDIAAPGSAITSTTYDGDPAIINAYEPLSGTSMATPHVAGIMALMRAQFPSESFQQLIYRLLDTADTSIMGGFVVSGGANLPAALSGAPTGPYNDDFDRARFLGQRSFTTLATNLLATAEPGEPAHAGAAASHSVWFEWVAPVDNTIDLYTEATDCDTVVAVYQGSDLGSLVEIASNDDDPNAGISGYDSYLNFAANDGDVFYIVVDSADGSTGSFSLTVENTPPNDDFVDASPWSGTAGTFRPENYGATKEPGEPKHGGLFGGSSLWYSYTPAYDGRLRVGNGAGSPVDLGFGIYSGTQVSGLIELDGVKAAKNTTANAYAYLESGNTYHIAVDTPDGKESWFFINWGYTSNEIRFNDLELTIAEDDPAGQIAIPVERYLGTGSGGTTEVSWGTSASPNDATDGVDYTSSDGTLTWSTDEAGLKTITIPILDNLLIQPDRILYVTLGTPTNGAYVSPAKRRIKIIITDDDNPLDSLPGTDTGYAFQFDSYSALTIDPSAWVAVRRLGETTAAGSVQLDTSNGSAVAGIDYAAASVSVSFSAGQTLAFVPIDLLTPTTGTNFTVTLSSPTDPGSAVLGGAATVNLTNAGGSFLDPITVVSRDDAGGIPAGVSGTSRVGVSDTGRFVVFDSALDGLVPGDGNGQSDIFLRDEATGDLHLISLSRFGGPAEGASTHPSISDDGRTIAYASTANDIVTTDANEHSDIFVFDRITGITILASLNSDGEQAEKQFVNLEDPLYTDCTDPEISGDGSSVIFTSDATNLDTLHPSQDWDNDVFVRDLKTGLTEYVSVGNGWLDDNFASGPAAISADGQTIAFISSSPGLLPEDTNNTKDDIFIRDRTSNTTTIASLLPGGGSHDNFGDFDGIALSGDGGTLAFTTTMPGWAGEASNEYDLDVFVRDLATGDITVANRDIFGSRIIGLSNNDGTDLALSHDGTHLAFNFSRSALIPYPADENTAELVFVRNLPSGSLFIASVAADDSLPNGAIGPIAMTPDASTVVFASGMEGLASGGNPAAEDVFGGPSGINDPQTRFFFPSVLIEVIKEEGSSVVDFSVRRSGNLANPVSITYNTVDGTATSGTDYNAASGILDFIAGEAEKTISITINNPPGNEPARNFFLVLDDSMPDTLFPTGPSLEVSLVGQFSLLNSIRRISEDASGTGGDQNSDFPSIDATGNLAVFSSNATNLVPGLSITTDNLFLHDSTDNTLELLTLDPHVPDTETAATYPVISGDGNWVVFRSAAPGLTPEGSAPSVFQVYLANLQTGAITLVSKSPANAPGNGSTNLYSGSSTTFDVRKHPFSVSENGRFVTFHSVAANLITSDSNSDTDIFLYDRDTDVLTRIDEAHGGGESIGESYNPSVSADGRYVAFVSQKADLVPNDTNGFADVFRYDRLTGSIIRVSIADDESEPNAPSLNCSISGDGNEVAFDSYASNLIGTSDTNGYLDCFVRDIAGGSTSRVSVASDGSQTVPFDFGYKLDGNSFGPAISADGGHIAFTSYSANLDPSVQFPPVSTFFLPKEKVYIHNRDSGGTVALIPAHIPNAYAETPGLSADGRVVALWSQSADLINSDNNARYDAFLAPNPTHPAMTSSGFALWQVLNFWHQAGDPAIGGPEADPENDFIVNIIEYMLGLDPTEWDPSIGSLVRFEPDPLSTDLELSFPISNSIDDVTWTVESSRTLAPSLWSTVPGESIRTELSIESPALDRIHLFVAPPSESDPLLFYRIQFTE